MALKIKASVLRMPATDADGQENTTLIDNIEQEVKQKINSGYEYVGMAAVAASLIILFKKTE